MVAFEFGMSSKQLVCYHLEKIIVSNLTAFDSRKTKNSNILSPEDFPMMEQT